MIGIIGAMDKEIALLKSSLEEMYSVKYADKVFYIGKMQDKEVVLVKSGIGKVNAAMTTVLLLNEFDIDYVINIGIAGGLTPVTEASMVVAGRLCYSDVDARDIDGLPYGQMPEEELFIYPDEALRKQALELLESEEEEEEIVFEGTLVSGDQFVTNPEKLEPIQSVVEDVVACEMEGMAIGVVCEKFNTPFLSIRGISDVINNEEQVSVYESISDKIAQKTSAFVIRFLGRINIEK